MLAPPKNKLWIDGVASNPDVISQGTSTSKKSQPQQEAKTSGSNTTPPKNSPTPSPRPTGPASTSSPSTPMPSPMSMSDVFIPGHVEGVVRKHGRIIVTSTKGRSTYLTSMRPKVVSRDFVEDEARKLLKKLQSQEPGIKKYKVVRKNGTVEIVFTGTKTVGRSFDIPVTHNVVKDEAQRILKDYLRRHGLSGGNLRADNGYWVVEASDKSGKRFIVKLPQTSRISLDQITRQYPTAAISMTKDGKYHVYVSRTVPITAKAEMPAYSFSISQTVYTPRPTSFTRPPKVPIPAPSSVRSDNIIKRQVAIEAARWNAMAAQYKAQEAAQRAKRAMELYGITYTKDDLARILAIGKNKELIEAAGLLSLAGKPTQFKQGSSAVGSKLGLNLGAARRAEWSEYDNIPSSVLKEAEQLEKLYGKDFLLKYYYYYNVDNVSPAVLAASAAGASAFGWIPIPTHEGGKWHIRPIAYGPTAKTWGDKYKWWIYGGDIAGTLLSLPVSYGAGKILGGVTGRVIERGVPRLTKLSKVVRPLAKVASKTPTPIKRGAAAPWRGTRALWNYGPKQLLTTRSGQIVLVGGLSGYQGYKEWQSGEFTLAEIAIHMAKNLGGAYTFQKGFTEALEPRLIARATMKASESNAVHRMPGLDKLKINTRPIKSWDDLLQLTDEATANRIALQLGKNTEVAKVTPSTAFDENLWRNQLVLGRVKSELPFSERLAMTKATPYSKAYSSGKSFLQNLRAGKEFSAFPARSIKPTPTPLPEGVKIDLKGLTRGTGSELFNFNRAGVGARVTKNAYANLEFLDVEAPGTKIRLPLRGGGVIKKTTVGLSDYAKSAETWEKLSKATRVKRFWLPGRDNIYWEKTLPIRPAGALTPDEEAYLNAGYFFHNAEHPIAQAQEGHLWELASQAAHPVAPTYRVISQPVVFDGVPADVNLPGAMAPWEEVLPARVVRIEDFLKDIEDTLKNLQLERMWRGAHGEGKMGYVERGTMRRFAADDAYKFKKGLVLSDEEKGVTLGSRFKGVGEQVDALKKLKVERLNPRTFRRPYYIRRARNLFKLSKKEAEVAAESKWFKPKVKSGSGASVVRGGKTREKASKEEIEALLNKLNKGKKAVKGRTASAIDREVLILDNKGLSQLEETTNPAFSSTAEALSTIYKAPYAAYPALLPGALASYMMRPPTAGVVLPAAPMPTYGQTQFQSTPALQGQVSAVKIRARSPVLKTVAPKVQTLYPTYPVIDIRFKQTPVRKVSSRQSQSTLTAYTPIIETSVGTILGQSTKAKNDQRLHHETSSWTTGTTTATPSIYSPIPPIPPAITGSTQPFMLPLDINSSGSSGAGWLSLGSGLFGYWIGGKPFLSGLSPEEVKFYRYFQWLVSQGVPPLQASDLAKRMLTRAASQKSRVLRTIPLEVQTKMAETPVKKGKVIDTAGLLMKLV